jgi:hypothetical protein
LRAAPRTGRHRKKLDKKWKLEETGREDWTPRERTKESQRAGREKGFLNTEENSRRKQDQKDGPLDGRKHSQKRRVEQTGESIQYLGGRWPSTDAEISFRGLFS